MLGAMNIFPKLFIALSVIGIIEEIHKLFLTYPSNTKIKLQHFDKQVRLEKKP
jgi:hypothetical protein